MNKPLKKALLVFVCLFAGTITLMLLNHDSPGEFASLFDKVADAGLVGGIFGAIVGAVFWVWVSLKSSLRHNGDESAQVAEKSRIEASQGMAQPTTVVATKEIIAFRFLLIAWATSLLTLLLSGASYLMAEWTQGKVSSTFSDDQSCINNVWQTTPDCNVPVTESDGTCSIHMQVCYLNLEQLVTERDEWNDRAQYLLYAVPWLLILPSLLFYGIRWATTGRLRPLWPLRR